MKWFPIHIVIKDLSFMIFYFLIMKYDLTNETYLPDTIYNFPGAPKMTFGNMISASIKVCAWLTVENFEVAS